MEDKFKDILSNLSTEIDQETLLLYLQGKLSEEKKHAIEKQLLKDEFDEDAVDGLQEFRDKEQLQYMVEMLNRDLRKKTARKKRTQGKDADQESTMALDVNTDPRNTDRPRLSRDQSYAEIVISILFCLPSSSRSRKSFWRQDVDDE